MRHSMPPGRFSAIAIRRGLRYLLILTSLSCGLAHSDIKLQIEDVPDELEKNILIRSGFQDLPCDTDEWRIERQFRNLDKAIEPALQAFGYYSAGVEKQLKRDEKCWQVELQVSPGPRTKIAERKIVVTGPAKDRPDLQQLIQGMPLVVGAPLHQGRYEQIKSELRDFAGQHGYLEFKFTRTRLAVNPETAEAVVDIEFDSGPQYRFGEMRYNQTLLDDKLVQRLAQWRAGVPYEANKLVGLDRRLSNSGFFGSVEVRAATPDPKTLIVPVDVQLTMAKRFNYRGGAGYATDTGPRVTLGFRDHYINSYGHSFDAQARLSQVESTLGLEYRIPGEIPSREYYAFGLKGAHEDTVSALSDSITLSAEKVDLWHDWTRSRFVELLYEDSKIGSEQVNATLVMPGIRLSRTVADDVFRTNQGYRIKLSARVAEEHLLSTATLLQLRAEAKGIYRFGQGGRITARIDTGTNLGGSAKDLPASLRFFAGGDYSVRGYAYESLGPTNKDGTPSGGDNLLTGSLEYEHPIYGQDWWGAVFVDAGNAFDLDEFDVKVGSGVGVRWYSPLGRIRFDLAIPNDTSKDSWRIHFSLGTDL